MWSGVVIDVHSLVTGIVNVLFYISYVVLLIAAIGNVISNLKNGENMEKKTVIETRVRMGEMYRDINSGFEGVAVAVTKWQFGCVRITLQPQTKEDINKLPGCETFDEQSLINDASGEHVKPVIKKIGGPSPDPENYKNVI